MRDRFCERDDWAFPGALALLRCDPFADYTKVRAPYPAASENNHTDASAVKVRVVSLDNNRLKACRFWNTTERVFTPVLENQRDRFAKIRARLLGGSPLAIRAGNLGTICDEPFLVGLDDRGEFVMHGARFYSTSFRCRGDRYDLADSTGTTKAKTLLTTHRISEVADDSQDSLRITA